MQTRLVGRASGKIKSTWKISLRELLGLVLKVLKTQLLGFIYVEPIFLQNFYTGQMNGSYFGICTWA